MHSFDDDFVLKNAKAQATPTTERASPEQARGPASVGTPAGILQLQRKIGNAGVAQMLHGDEDRQSIDNATRSGGQPLDSANRVQMEAAFGTDFSSVRVHTGGDADASAKQLGAHAYTVGDDVVFAGGRYEPETPTGQRTLAHELTHVVQQRSGPVEGTETGGGVKVSHPSDQYEQAAESMAEHVVAGRMADTAPAPVAPSTGAAVQREDDDGGGRDHAVQREGEEEEEVQALAVQREGDEEEEVQTLAVQREGEEEEEVQALAVQREGETEEEEAMA